MVWIASAFAEASADTSPSLAMMRKDLLPSRTEFQALEPGGDVDADLALQAERLQRDGIVGAADQRVAASAVGANTPQASAVSWVMPRSSPTFWIVAM